METYLPFFLLILISLFAGSAFAATFNSSAQISSSTMQSGLNRGLVGYWTMDGKDTRWTSASAGTMLDRSGNGNTGTLVGLGRATSTSIGKVGQAMKFDGVGGAINSGKAGVPGSDMTYSLWIYPTLNIASQGLMERWSSAGTGPILYITTTDDISWQIGNSTSNRLVITNVLKSQKWQYITATFHENGANDDMAIYLNGVLVASSSKPTFDNNSNITFNLGNNDGVNGFFRGLMDDVRVYDRALSASEVKQLYNQGR